MKRLPILKLGAYGLHVILNPAGTYSFVGSIPLALTTDGTQKTPVFKSEREAIEYVITKLPNEKLNLNSEGLTVCIT